MCIRDRRRVRDHLEFGKYHPSMNMTTTNYVLNVMAQVKHLTPPIEAVSYTHLLNPQIEVRRIPTVGLATNENLSEFILISGILPCKAAICLSFSSPNILKYNNDLIALSLLKR